MKKLTTMFAVVAFAASLGATGCKKKNAEEGKDPGMKTEEKGSDTMAGSAAAKPDDKKPDEKKPDGSAAAPAAAGGDTGGLPAECGAYKEMMDKYFACDKIPQAARDAAKTAFDAAWKQWADMPAEGKASLGAACKAAADGAKAMTCPG